MLKKMVVLSVITSASLLATSTWAGTKVAGDLVLFDGGEIVFADGSVQSRAQVQGPVGPQGPAGPVNQLSLGTVTTGTQAAATLTGTAPNQTLNLTLPQGPKGDSGTCTNAKEVITAESAANLSPDGSTSFISNTVYFRDNATSKLTGWNVSSAGYTFGLYNSPSLSIGVCTEHDINNRHTKCKVYPSGGTNAYAYAYDNSNNLVSRTRTISNSSGAIQEVTVTNYDSYENIVNETKSNASGAVSDVLTYTHTYGPSGKSLRAIVAHTIGATDHNIIYQHEKICQ